MIQVGMTCKFLTRVDYRLDAQFSEDGNVAGQRTCPEVDILVDLMPPLPQAEYSAQQDIPSPGWPKNQPRVDPFDIQVQTSSVKKLF